MRLVIFVCEITVLIMHSDFVNTQLFRLHNKYIRSITLFRDFIKYL